MNFTEIIARKRDGLELSGDQVRKFVRGATDGSIRDEQLAAMLMAICIRGAGPAETQALVEAMRDSGARWRLAEAYPEIVDKHSTGGVGDSTSLVFAPLVASCGVPVAMMAGAGLGHTQGTLDKLASIPGFATASDRAEALARIEACGVCFAAQSAEIAPADKKLYALRDVTGSVPSLPLIVASVMSKKLAVGAGRLVLDVKWGSGAFRKTLADARELADGLVAVADRAGVAVRALISDMNEPLCERLGCANEVLASIEVLAGRGSRALRELTIELAVAALVLAGRSEAAARAELDDAIASGRAREKFDAVVSAHGGDPDPDRLARPARTVKVAAPRAGFVSSVAAEELGLCAVLVGAGRRFQGDDVDHAAGLTVHARIGDRIDAGMTLAELELGARAVEVAELSRRVMQAFTISDEAPAPRPLIAARLRGSQ